MKEVVLFKNIYYKHQSITNKTNEYSRQHLKGRMKNRYEREDIVKDCLHLKNLIDSHDFVFLLTDTREIHWLPTLLYADTNKVAITAAPGFDTFLVMRPPHTKKKIPGGLELRHQS